jgi:hypothetical protein
MSKTNRRFPGRTFYAGLLLLVAGNIIATRPGHLLAGAATIAVGLLLAGIPLYLRLRSGAGSTALIGRWDRKTRRNGGTASRRDIFTTSSTWAMRRKAAVLRPSLRDLGFWERWRTPVLSYATPLVKVGRQTVWTSGEESTLRVGIPGTGKTAELACRVIDAPGEPAARSPCSTRRGSAAWPRPCGGRRWPAAPTPPPRSGGPPT